ncbi:MAG: lactate racemase domain-containing protein [Thermodesulfobacteriota bacterium]|jgi:hypothetical protein
MKLPSLVKIIQEFEENSIQDVEGKVKSELEKAGIRKLVKPGQKIALPMTSRSVSNIGRVLKATAEIIKACKAEPFIVLGMGSHGGATVEGQLKIAEKFGVTEKSIGIPIKATMEVVPLGTTSSGIPVFMDRYAYEADGVIVIHRVKPHRHVMGPHQSGLLKMLTIGLGKLKGAATVHSFGWENFARNLVEVSSVVLKKAPILLGLALVKNGFSKTAIIEAVKPENFVERDGALLQTAIQMLPRVPFDKIDVLVVKEMGKNMPPDTDIIGRPTLKYYTEVKKPSPSRIVILDLHDDSMGNAIGMGSFDYTTQRLFKKIDFHVTAINSIAGNVPEAGKIPLPLENDRKAVEAALQNAGFPDVEGVGDIQQAKLVVIKNTKEMQVVYASQCLAKAINDPQRAKVVGPPLEFPFDQHGNIALDFK